MIFSLPTLGFLPVFEGELPTASAQWLKAGTTMRAGRCTCFAAPVEDKWREWCEPPAG
jgi:hypothetical protein